jgi:hypothetical protein
MTSANNPYAAPGPPLPDGIVMARFVSDDGGTTIEYEYTVEDLVEFSLYYNLNSPTARRTFWRKFSLIACALLIAGGALCWLLFSQGGNLLTVGLIILMIGMLIGTYPWRYRRRLRQMVTHMYREGNKYNHLGPRRLVLSPQQLNFASPISQTIVRWPGVEKIAVGPKALYIFLAPYSAIIVPRHALGTSTEFEALVQLAEDYQAAAGPGI